MQDSEQNGSNHFLVLICSLFTHNIILIFSVESKLVIFPTFPHNRFMQIYCSFCPALLSLHKNRNSFGFLFVYSVTSIRINGKYSVAQLVEALRYKPEGRGFDSRWFHLNFFIDIILPAALCTWGRLSL